MTQRQYVTPVADQRLDEVDRHTWSSAMAAYAHGRELGLSRKDAVEAVRPLLDHPRLATAAQIMLDLARAFPE